jgi:hypothetical protein
LRLPPRCQKSHQRRVASDIAKLADFGKQLLAFLGLQEGSCDKT